MSSNEHDTSTPAASPPPSPRRLAPGEIGGWVAALSITVVAAVAAAIAGVALGVFGLAGVAFVAIAVLLWLALGPWRRAGLALAVIGTSLAATAAATTLEVPRFALSSGLLVVKPARAADVDGQSYRRGLGSVVVDLRQARFRSGERIAFSARSDAGRVVVALPAGRCIDVRLTVNPLVVDSPMGASLVMSAAGSLGASAPDERFLAAANYPSDPFQVDLVTGGGLIDELGPLGGGATLYGRDLFRRWDYEEQRRTQPVTISRTTGVSGAPRLDLELSAPGAVVVRDLPDGIGPMATGEYAGSQQVSDASWPRPIELPANPAARTFDGKWRRDWSRSPRQLRAWQRWEREVAVAAHAQAKRLAGPCATRSERQSQWVTARYGARPGNGDGSTRLIAVNALGETVVRGLPGTHPASPTRARIVAGTGLRLLAPSDVAPRRGQYFLTLQVSA